MLHDTVVAAVRPSVVDSGGVVDLADAHRELVAVLGGGRLGEDALRSLLADTLGERQGPLAELPGDRVADVATLAERLVLTHRVSEHERRSATLDLDPDLGALARLADVDGGLHLPDGTPLQRVDRRERGAGPAGNLRWSVHLRGPDGWLDGCAPGRLVAVRAADGIIRLEDLDDADVDLSPPAGFDRALGELFDACNEGDGLPVLDEDLLLLAAADHRDWFALPRAPFGELVADAGYEICGRDVGRPGSWEEQRKVAEAVGTTARHIDLPHEAHATLAAALDAFDGWRREPGVAPPSALAQRLTVSWPAALALVEELRRRGATPHDLDGFASALAAAAVGTTPVPAWLASCAAALDGRPLDAERLAAEAHDLDPSYVPAAEEVAWHATDRGRAREAVNLLHRIRYPDDPEVEILRRMAALQSPDVGRNAPCPCGSGRKFKQCHLGRVEPPETDRMRWLLDKARTHLLRAAPPELLDDTVSPHEDEDGLHLAAMDVLLFDGGWLERFLDARRPLLDAWEVAAAERWRHDNAASVYRVDAVDDDGRHHLTDTATGTTRVAEPSPVFDPVGRHRLVWCRLVPVGDRWRPSGVGRVVTLADRAAILDAWSPGTPVEARIEALCRPQPFGRRDTAGQPQLVCSSTLATAAGLDGAAVADRLDRCLERDDPDGSTWLLVREPDGGERAVLGSVSQTATRLIATSNSAARHDELLDRLRDALGEVTVVAEERVPIARHRAAIATRELVAAARRILARDHALAADEEDEDDEEDRDDGDDPDLGEDFDRAPGVVPDRDAHERSVLDAAARTFERRWTDMPVTALGGRTPREAAGDDALRPDLLTLLAEMEERNGRDEVDRLRQGLGLTGT